MISYIIKNIIYLTTCTVTVYNINTMHAGRLTLTEAVSASLCQSGVDCRVYSNNTLHAGSECQSGVTGVVCTASINTLHAGSECQSGVECTASINTLHAGTGSECQSGVECTP